MNITKQFRTFTDEDSLWDYNFPLPMARRTGEHESWFKFALWTLREQGSVKIKIDQRKKTIIIRSERQEIIFSGSNYECHYL